jgi:hypothetical protein
VNLVGVAKDYVHFGGSSRIFGLFYYGELTYVTYGSMALSFSRPESFNIVAHRYFEVVGIT